MNQYKKYIQHRRIYEQQIWRAGLQNLHRLRYSYRCKELTGWDAPINGGSKSRELTPEQNKNYEARMILTEELGHSWEPITVNYLGR